MALRCFCPQKIHPDLASIEICEAQKHHLLKVLRVKKGECIEILDGQGGIMIGRLDSVSAQQPLRIQKESFRQVAAPATKITLAQALPLSKTFEDILKYGTSLGVSTFQPLFTERSQCPYEIFKKQAKIERFQSILIEACKQSGNPFLPILAHPVPLTDWLPAVSSAACTYIASLEAAACPMPAIPKGAGQVIAVVGPEGDFSAQEYTALKQAGFKPIWLNPYVLRSEAAALAMLAQIQRALA